jgi:hypothetical protein
MLVYIVGCTMHHIEHAFIQYMIDVILAIIFAENSCFNGVVIVCQVCWHFFALGASDIFHQTIH